MTSEMGWLFTAASSLFSGLVWLVGIVLSLVHLRRLGRPALLTLVACVLSLLGGLATSLLQFFVVRTGGSSAAQISMVYGLLGIFRGVIFVITMALLLAAIFLRREEPTDRP